MTQIDAAVVDQYQECMERMADRIAAMRVTLAPETGPETNEEDMMLALRLGNLAGGLTSTTEITEALGTSPDEEEIFIFHLLGVDTFAGIARMPAHVVKVSIKTDCETCDKRDKCPKFKRQASSPDGAKWD